MSKSQSAIQTVQWSILANIVLAAVKGTTGYFGQSFALVADAIESSTDVLASFIVLLGLWYAARPADDNHPYGHGRVESLITFIVVGFLVISAVGIGWHAIHNIRTPHEAPKSFTLWVLAGIILWKELSYHWVLRKSKETNSSSLRAEAWHHRSDAISSVAAFVGISIALWLGAGYESADDWAALFAAVFILYNSYTIFRPALGEIMDEHLYHEVEEQIRTYVLQVDGVLGTEKCQIRKLGMEYLVDLHLIVQGSITVREGHTIAHRAKDYLKQRMPEIADILIHIEPDS